jgi:hypothetical protein
MASRPTLSTFILITKLINFNGSEYVACCVKIDNMFIQLNFTHDLIFNVDTCETAGQFKIVRATNERGRSNTE